jgi:hypothetical protein
MLCSEVFEFCDLNKDRAEKIANKAEVRLRTRKIETDGS